MFTPPGVWLRNRNYDKARDEAFVVGGAGGVSGSDLPGTLEASGMAATVQRRGRTLASMNREAVLAPGRQTPETDVGMEPTSVASE